MILSVIIPVYRVEATLDRCVESVLKQSIDNMEVILVNDGSPDRCPEMCDKWAQKDCRIKVIHKENGGLSDARNVGLDKAQGDYITFVDSDDWLEDNTYPSLLPLMEKCDIVEFSIAGRLILQDRTYHNTEEYWLKERAYTHAFACNKLYRRSVFDKVRFPKGKVFEDTYTLPKLLQHAHTIMTTHYGYYHYCWNPKGITATDDGHGLAQLLDAHLNTQMPMDDSYYMHIVNVQMDVWEMTGAAIRIPKRRVNPKELSGKSKFKAYLLNILGINILCRINIIIHLFKHPSRS